MGNLLVLRDVSKYPIQNVVITNKFQLANARWRMPAALGLASALLFNVQSGQLTVSGNRFAASRRARRAVAFSRVVHGQAGWLGV
jgi:hypothetical protein